MHGVDHSSGGTGVRQGSTYNIMPGMFNDIRSNFEAGDVAKAMAIQVQCNQVIATLMDGYDFKVNGFNIIAALHAVLRHQGHAVGDPPDAMSSRAWTDEDEATLIGAMDALPFPIY
jgi:dihydrodipicolinate synthase/N-acetylneuraminate lyase